MNIRPTTRLTNRLAFLQLDVAVAITVLALVFIPLSVSSSGDLDLARRHYFEAVALQLTDGEMDVLLAGALPSAAVPTTSEALHPSKMQKAPPPPRLSPSLSPLSSPSLSTPSAAHLTLVALSSSGGAAGGRAADRAAAALLVPHARLAGTGRRGGGGRGRAMKARPAFCA